MKTVLHAANDAVKAAKAGIKIAAIAEQHAKAGIKDAAIAERQARL